jgi:hypothetical protein
MVRTGAAPGTAPLRTVVATVSNMPGDKEKIRPPPVKRRHTVKSAPWVLIGVLLLFSVSVHADSVVLIVSALSPIRELESGELRKLFMGFRVVSDGVPLRAARNLSDPRLDKIFLQNVVSLSALVYERQLLSRRLREASALPTEFMSGDELLDAVAHDPRTISYAWATAAAKRSDVRVLRTLWHD